VSFLWLVRVLTVVVGVMCCITSVSVASLEWLHDHLTNSSVIYEADRSPILTAAGVGVCIAATVSIPLALFAISRWRWTIWALAACFLMMGVSHLGLLEASPKFSYFDWIDEVLSYAQVASLALPPLILGAILCFDFVQEKLSPRAPTPDV
jgi:hypothetical protein